MTQSIDSNLIGSEISSISYSNNYPVITITSPKSSQKILEISNDGEVFFLINGEFKKIDCESDVALMFYSVISELTGILSKDKDEMMSKIIRNYRDNKVNKILK